MSAILNPPIEYIHRKTDRKRLNNNNPYDILSFGYGRWRIEARPRTDIPELIKTELSRETKAIWAERTRYKKVLEAQLEIDREDKEVEGIIQFASKNRTAYFTGDIEYEHRYFSIGEYKLEGSTLIDVKELNTSNVDLQYYSKDPSEFHQVVKLLSPWAKY
jgi:hypothetical protein